MFTCSCVSRCLYVHLFPGVYMCSHVHVFQSVHVFPDVYICSCVSMGACVSIC